MKKRMKKRMVKLNNSGSAILSVVVITAFITVLATTMLYMTGQNYQQKQTDYQNKKSFYGVEDALDGFKAVLAEDASDAYKEACDDTSRNFLKLSDNAARMNNYNDKYVQRLEEIWKDRVAAETGDSERVKLLAAVRAVVKKGLTGSLGETDAEEVAKRIYYV
jgi:ABC-type transport system involved in cytochrome bd biosynthesis fused ATPase/permease subunit